MSTELHLGNHGGGCDGISYLGQTRRAGCDRTNKERAHNEQTMNTTVLPLRKVLILLCALTEIIRMRRL